MRLLIISSSQLLGSSQMGFNQAEGKKKVSLYIAKKEETET